MTTKSPTSTCGAYWGLCLPRSRVAVWVASRPSTTSVASMTCHARLTSPGLGVYVRTALVSSVVVGMAGGFASPSTGDGSTRAAPAGLRAPAGHDTSVGTAPSPRIHRTASDQALRPQAPLWWRLFEHMIDHMDADPLTATE